ncbi:DMT family transporter [Novosphingobium sp. Fuku2-ISO-50]|uniref:DMT family transporter n=1 Tax=Novosphingobium sp. Fuku2-ISO-50 TaxID=1739114 RepID=UPI00076DC094|nr:EamA family transporter [Novosphingobium sp. Fuku2-ISO-50]KUR77388.1 multidrug transporter [Novosphingobium sp. Fuku2-ISO-50]
MSTHNRSSDPRVIAAFVVTALVWGSTWLVIKGQIGPVPPSWSVTWRFAGAALGMFALGLVRGDIRLGALVPERPVLIHAGLIGVSLFCANFQFVYRAESHLTSGLVAVVFALLLLPNAVFSRIFLGTPVTRGFALGSAIALSGIVLLMIAEYRTAPVGSDVPLGAAMTGLALLCASTGNVLQAAQVVRRVPAAMLLAWAFLIGAVVDFGVAWVLSGPPVFDWSPVYMGSVAYLALIGSVLTFPLYNLLLREMGPGRAAYNGVVVPVVAMLLSTAFEGYRWTGLNLGGAGLALIGLVVALRSRKPSR